MTSVSAGELGKRIFELLGGVKEGESVDLSKLRDGSVLLTKVESS
jgi:hypothetical protein